MPARQVLLSAYSSIGFSFLDPVAATSKSEVSRRVLKDNSEPFRIVRRVFGFADAMLDSCKPDLVYSYEWAKPWLFPVWLAAVRRGIPCIAVRRSKIRSEYCYFTADRLLFNTAAENRARATRTSSDVTSENAMKFIREFRAKPRMVDYIQANWRLAERDGWIRWHARFARSVLREAVSALRRSKPRRRAATLGRLAAFNRQLIAEPLQRRYFTSFGEKDLAEARYVYFPMHKETDLPLNNQASAWFDQRNTARLLASVLPTGYRLLVREHRRNYNSRPSGYYRELSRLPNLTLVDAFDSQYKYVRNADIIVTENGSSGWEGLMLGRRVITLSQTFYDGAGLARVVRRPDQLGAAMLETLSAPAGVDTEAHNRALTAMIDAEYSTTIAMDNPDPESVIERLRAVIAEARSDAVSTGSDIPRAPHKKLRPRPSVQNA